MENNWERQSVISVIHVRPWQQRIPLLFGVEFGFILCSRDTMCLVTADLN